MHKPFWVEIGLFGIKSRTAALAWLISSIFITILLFILTVGFMNIQMEVPLIAALIIGVILSALFSLAPVWYWLSIRWMDINDGWMQESREKVYDYRSRAR